MGYKVYLCIFLYFIGTIFCLEECDFPAIFNFGDSNSDTGGMAAAFIPPSLPYGETHFHMPVGRFSDGRLVIDFIAKSFDLPFLSGYLDSMGANFTHGANFATASATIKLPNLIIPDGGRAGFSPFFLQVQFLQFLQFKPRSQLLKDIGGIFANLMPKEEYFQKALYTFDIGQNDIHAGIFSNMSIQEFNATIPDLLHIFSINIKNLYDLGARSFWVHNTGPIGCLPYILTNFPSNQTDNSGCIKIFNDLAQYFNRKLKDAIIDLRKNLHSAAITYVDVYSPKYALFSNPEKFGFKHPLITCCGSGGKYNYSNDVICGETIDVNGTQIFVNSCDHPSSRVIWDGIHYTDSANKFIFDQISSGAFSYPPTPLKMACHKHLHARNTK